MKEIALLIAGATLPFLFRMAAEWIFSHQLKTRLMTDEIMNKAARLARIEAEFEKEYSDFATKEPDESGITRHRIGSKEATETEYHRYKQEFLKRKSEEIKLSKEVHPMIAKTDRMIRCLMLHANNPLSEYKNNAYQKAIKRTGGFREFNPSRTLVVLEQRVEKP